MLQNLLSTEFSSNSFISNFSKELNRLGFWICLLREDLALSDLLLGRYVVDSSNNDFGWSADAE